MIIVMNNENKKYFYENNCNIYFRLQSINFKLLDNNKYGCSNNNTINPVAGKY